MVLPRQLLAFPGALCAACVGYEPAPVALPELAAELAAREAPPLDFPAALAFAREHNPELAALAAEARAAAVDVPGTDLVVGGSQVEDRLSVAIDPLALLRMAQRGGAVDEATARSAMAWAVLAERQWRLSAAIAEAFAVDRALQGVAPPVIDVDPVPARDAGLMSAAGAARLQAARAAGEAEAAAIAAARNENLALLRRLLGLSPTAELVLVATDEEFPPLPEANPDHLLDRPDLVVALARYETADAVLRRAVLDQYPSLVLGTQIPLSGMDPGALVAVRLPIDAAGPARAAAERREGARAELVAALLAVQEEADAGAAAFAAAEVQARATELAASASAMALVAGRQAVEVEPDAFEPLSRLAVMAVEGAVERREAAVDSARARARLAAARGWPAEARESPAEVPR